MQVFQGCAYLIPPSLTGTKKNAKIFITVCIRIHSSIAVLEEMGFIGKQMLSKSGVSSGSIGEWCLDDNNLKI